MIVLRSMWAVVFCFILLVAALLIGTPALAQSSAPAASQYTDCGSTEANAQACAAGVEDGVQAFSANAQQGANAVNDAMADPGGASSAPPGSVLSAETASPEAGETEAGSEGQGLSSIEELPETGGAPLLVLCAGVALVGCGLLVRRVAL